MLHNVLWQRINVGVTYVIRQWIRALLVITIMKLSWFNHDGSVVSNNNNSLNNTSDKDTGTSLENNNAVSHMHAAYFMVFSILFLGHKCQIEVLAYRFWGQCLNDAWGSLSFPACPDNTRHTLVLGTVGQSRLLSSTKVVDTTGWQLSVWRLKGGRERRHRARVV